MNTFVFGDIFTVTNTMDDGDGSLRWALGQAIQNAGPDTIQFDIPLADPGFNGTIWRIRLQTNLQNLTGGNTTILGRSQTASQGDQNPEGPELLLDGSDIGAGGFGFSIVSSNNTVSGLGISGFASFGISIWGDETRDNTVRGNHIGRTIFGDDTLRNGTGIYIANNVGSHQIGGIGSEQRNVISGNMSDGIHISGSNNNVIINNIIGLSISGMDIISNGGDGIDIRDGSSDNRIGGNRDTEGNLVSGNRASGISISGTNTTVNMILGNLIGTNSTGTVSVGNMLFGIYISGGSQGNKIGGAETKEGNIISGNNRQGIFINNSQENTINYNQIGTDLAGELDLGNTLDGIFISQGGQRNSIGPNNLIRYNERGVRINGAATLYNPITQNSISGNLSGGIILEDGGNLELDGPVITDTVNVRGTAPANSTIEIFSDASTQGKTYEATVYTDENGNFEWNGVATGPNVTATVTDSQGNTSEFSLVFRVLGFTVSHTGNSGEGSLRWAITQANNHPGPDDIFFHIPTNDPGFNGSVWTIQPQSNLPSMADGFTSIDGSTQTEEMGDTNPDGPEIILDGIHNAEGLGLTMTSSNNYITGLVISNFEINGIRIIGVDAHHNHIEGNYIGTNAQGTQIQGNYEGVLIFAGSKNNVVGGQNKFQRNVISGNINDGIHIDQADSNVVIGNFLGVDRTGTVMLGNGSGGLGDGVDIRNGSQGNRVGGQDPGDKNVLSGNGSVGVRIHHSGTRGNIVQGNFIGTDSSGISPLPNEWYGVFIQEGAHGNLIGGVSENEANVISGNGVDGIAISGAGSDTNQVLGNYIGTDVTGRLSLGNQENGILLVNSVRHNFIGPGNIISGNFLSGILLQGACVDSNQVFGNWIGLDVTGQDTIANREHGIFIKNNAKYNLIGGSDLGYTNVVSGNNESGIVIEGDSTGHNHIQNNFIGTDDQGVTSFGNGSSGLILSGFNNTVQENLISGNQENGLLINGNANHNIIQNNKIGTQLDGWQSLPNMMSGIRTIENAFANTIGPANQIWGNKGYGIELIGENVHSITVTRNSIATNDSGGIRLYQGANNEIDAPTITSTIPIQGTAIPGSKIEIFSDPSGQGSIYQGIVTADSTGNWIWDYTAAGPNVTATATDSLGNTSEFSNSLTVSVDSKHIEALPMSCYIFQNHPNPFNSQTTIGFGVKKQGRIALTVYNLLGQKIITLIDNEIYSAGRYKVHFNASNVPSGLYIYQIEMDDFNAIRKMVILE